MKLARVAGIVVSTVKEVTHRGYKMMIVDHLDLDLSPTGETVIAFDAVGAGVGDIVLINREGGSAKMILNDKEVIADATICGIVDHINIGSRTVTV